MKGIAFTLLILAVLSATARVETADAAMKEFAGLNFGVGLSLTIDTGSHDRIESAELDPNGIVRASKVNNDVPRIMLESHYIFEGDKDIKGKPWGWGPFVAIQPGTDETIDAIGLGFMVAFKRSSKDDEDTSSWNLGIAAVVDPSVRILGDGINENQALPAGETQIRFKETSQWGVLVMTTFSF